MWIVSRKSKKLKGDVLPQARNKADDVEKLQQEVPLPQDDSGPNISNTWGSSNNVKLQEHICSLKGELTGMNEMKARMARMEETLERLTGNNFTDPATGSSQDNVEANANRSSNGSD